MTGTTTAALSLDLLRERTAALKAGKPSTAVLAIEGTGKAAKAESPKGGKGKTRKAPAKRRATTDRKPPANATVEGKRCLVGGKSGNRTMFIADHEWAENATSANALAYQVIVGGMPLVGNWAIGPVRTERLAEEFGIDLDLAKERAHLTAPAKGKKAKKGAKATASAPVEAEVEVTEPEVEPVVDGDLEAEYEAAKARLAEVEAALLERNAVEAEKAAKAERKAARKAAKRIEALTTELRALTFAELRVLCREASIKGRSTMNSNQMVNALVAAYTSVA